jgi:tetratricopeptide (TPR) repeat protein
LRMVNVYLVQREFEAALEIHRKAVQLLEALAAEAPNDIRYELALAGAHRTMGNWSYSFQRRALAKEEFRKALEAYRSACRQDPDGKAHDGLALLLCDCQATELRDPMEAVAVAQQAVVCAPEQRAFWNTLGLAHYRGGEYSLAQSALRKSMEFSGGGDPNDWLILAMLAWKKGERNDARRWYNQSARWLQSHPLTDELYHLRKDASEMMNIHLP